MYNKNYAHQLNRKYLRTYSRCFQYENLLDVKSYYTIPYAYTY